MNQQEKIRWRELRNLVATEQDSLKLLNMFLELDRLVVERSLRLYKIPHPQRFIVREQNRRLHDAIRRHRTAQSRARKSRVRT